MTSSWAEETSRSNRAAARQSPSLLVLDNCEHLIEAAAELTAFLVSAAPDLRVLTTSRAPLAIAGERVYPLSELGTDDAARLFRKRAVAARPIFTPRHPGRHQQVRPLTTIRPTLTQARCLAPAGVPQRGSARGIALPLPPFSRCLLCWELRADG
jgi:hypothetical protein